MGHPIPGGYKYRNMVLQVVGVSDETVIYSYGSCVTLTSQGLHCKLQIHTLIRDGTLLEVERK
jgi:hypothetical protein